ncbi:MAG: hypothetical protein AB7P20_25480, partial [Rhizobiaceae bacterium]
SVVTIRGDYEESTGHLARHLGTGHLRRSLFQAVYGRGERPKTKRQLMTLAGIDDAGTNAQQAQNELDHLAKHHLIVKLKSEKPLHDGSRNLYAKDDTVRANRARIVSYADNRRRRESVATKRSTASVVGTAGPLFTVIHKDVAFPPREITVDEIDSFSAVPGIAARRSHLAGISEEKFKHGVQAIIGEKGIFKDWGGEKSDLLSTRLVLDGKRRGSAFAFKGPGQSGVLTPARMGKNGDQALRLFEEPADVFIVQHWREIGSAVRTLVQSLALAHSVTRRKSLIYCFIDGQDSQRLLDAYPDAFK